MRLSAVGQGRRTSARLVYRKAAQSQRHLEDNWLERGTPHRAHWAYRAYRFKSGRALRAWSLRPILAPSASLESRESPSSCKGSRDARPLAPRKEFYARAQGKTIGRWQGSARGSARGRWLVQERSTAWAFGFYLGRAVNLRRVLRWESLGEAEDWHVPASIHSDVVCSTATGVFRAFARRALRTRSRVDRPRTSGGKAPLPAREAVALDLLALRRRLPSLARAYTRVGVYTLTIEHSGGFW